ncbi:PAS domain-containing sensor histidine kinase [Haloarchaeobius litoreus]|uniref:histidine kinase n=1 Tax=Haloarchaeobius litoreus TaxID=755306 RepID=A0ABD6DIS4_9EURY|nr:ATP-binding protein [Haloarchaeobius litoreus]
MTDSSLESSDPVLETLVENMPEGVLIENASREILLVNERLCDLLNIPYETAALVGMDCEDAGRHVADRFAETEEFVPRITELLERREPVQGEEVELADGRTLERTYVPYDHPEGEANIWLYRDVTERASHEAELERQNERLAEFASVVSHDLRNPLSVATTSLQLAREDCDSDHLDEIERSLDRMDRLTTQLLTLAREGERTEELEPTPVSALVSQSWNNVETGGATLVNDTSGIVLADWSRLGQLFENLFRNAVEHGGDDVRVRVESTEDGFVVEDDGVGLHDVDVAPERLFDTGYSSKDDGTGLGLGIVHEIATAHDWTVQLEEVPDGGLRFEVTGVEFER